MIGIKKGSIIFEHAVLLTAVCLAIVATQIYLKRAVQGRYKSSTDQIGEQFSGDWSNYAYITTMKSTREETLTTAGAAESKLLAPEIIHRSPYTDRFSDKKLTEEKLFE